jgi:hypothetical protein
MSTPFERLRQAQEAIEAAKQQEADAMKALKQSFGVCSVEVQLSGTSMSVVLTEQSSRSTGRTGQIRLPMAFAVEMARYLLDLSAQMPPEYLEPPPAGTSSMLKPSTRTTPTPEG